MADVGDDSCEVEVDSLSVVNKGCKRRVVDVFRGHFGFGAGTVSS